jgi:predicted nucleotidyltransferase
VRRLSTGYEIKQRFEESRSEVEEVFECEELVVLAYVFGSIASGDVGKLSDIDFGVYFGEEAEEEGYLDVELELRKQLSPLVGEEMDLVVMNTSSTLMKFNIISEGKIVYEESSDSRVSTESEIMSRHYDRQYYDRRHVEKKLEQYAERGLT